MIEGEYITGPPFDHTTFGDEGHYLFIRVSDFESRVNSPQQCQQLLLNNKNAKGFFPNFITYILLCEDQFD